MSLSLSERLNSGVPISFSLLKYIRSFFRLLIDVFNSIIPTPILHPKSNNFYTLRSIPFFLIALQLIHLLKMQNYSKLNSFPKPAMQKLGFLISQTLSMIFSYFFSLSFPFPVRIHRIKRPTTGGRDKCGPNADVHANLHFWTIVKAQELWWLRRVVGLVV